MARRALLAAAGLGLALTAAPAAADVQLFCVSVGLSCQSFSCPAGTTTVFDNGFNDTGPWVVICRPNKV
jgi:hypothetical protein